MSVPAEIPRRRNGRPQACEPCRRRKVACDHRLPICSRCIRKSAPQSCRYLIQGRLVTPALSSVGRRSQLISSPLLALEDLASSSDRNVGYLGATSFPAFYRETQKHLGLEPASDGLTSSNDGRAVTNTMVPDAAAFETALAILRAIPTKGASYFLYRRNINPADLWCRLAMDRLHDSLWATLGHLLDGERSNEALSQLALLLFRNSSKPLKEDIADPDQWYEAFSGASFRWEGLGIMFASWTFGATTLSENINTEQRKQLGGNYSRRNLMQTYKNSTTKCVDLCRLTDSCNNTMMVFLLHANSLTASVITGDTGAEFWRQHAEAVAMMTFLGLHTAQSQSPNLLPEDCVSVQAKRKLFCAVFRTDMMLSTLTGRPPLLSSRLCSIPLPLDIDNISLMNSNIKNHHGQLDKDGWNIEEKNYSTAFLRATYIILKIRSEILEMVLQVPNLASNYDYDELRKREMDAMLRFPFKLQLKSADFNNPDVGGPALHAKLITRLEHLSNLFFIERLSYKGDGLYSAEMLEISLEMISLTVMFWTQQNRLEGLQGDYEWLVLVYAGPAGGILCLELLRTSSNAAEASTTANPKVTKSMIIKQLTLLTGFLEWIGPSTPGAHLCNSIRTVVERVIEQALNPAPKPLTQQQEFDIAWDTSLPEDMNDFDFGLLDTFDWLRLPPTAI